MASRFMPAVAIAWAGASVGVGGSCYSRTSDTSRNPGPTLYNVLTVLGLWCLSGTWGQILCLSAHPLFDLVFLQRSVILVRSSECRSVWLGLAWLEGQVFPLLAVRSLGLLGP